MFLVVFFLLNLNIYYKIYMFEVSTFSGLILVLVVVTWNFYELEGYLQGLCLKEFDF